MQFGTLPKRPEFEDYAARLVQRPAYTAAKAIDEALGQWQQHFESRQQALQHELQQCDGELDRLREQDRQAVREQSQWELEQKQLRQERQQLQALQQRFALVESRAVLETCRRDVQAQRDALVVRLGQAQSRPPASIERELARAERVQPPSMTRTVNCLQEDGYVERRPHETDGRQVVVSITESGRARYTYSNRQGESCGFAAHCRL